MMLEAGWLVVTKTTGGIAMGTVDCSKVKPLLELDAERHGHHDVLAGVLDRMAKMGTDRDTLAWLAYAIAVQLVWCRCREGRMIRSALRKMSGWGSRGPIAFVVCEGEGLCEKKGTGTHRTATPEYRKAKREGRSTAGLRAPIPTSKFVLVSVDVVLSLAGMYDLSQKCYPLTDVREVE